MRLIDGHDPKGSLSMCPDNGPVLMRATRWYLSIQFVIDASSSFVERWVPGLSDLVIGLGEPALHQVHPRAVHGREVEAEPRVSHPPAVNLRHLVHGTRCRRRGGRRGPPGRGTADEVQEASELDGPVALGRIGHHVTSSDIEGHIEIGVASSHVITGTPFGQSKAKREHWLRFDPGAGSGFSRQPRARTRRREG